MQKGKGDDEADDEVTVIPTRPTRAAKHNVIKKEPETAAPTTSDRSMSQLRSANIRLRARATELGESPLESCLHTFI